METTSLYEDGLLARRRTDSDGDGQADTWSFYSGDELLRTEIDKNGDGFRDEITIYEHGARSRAKRSTSNGDGRPDVVSIYVHGQLDEKREDLDFDGTPDVVSHYKNGKLASREAELDRRVREVAERERQVSALHAPALLVRHRVHRRHLARHRAARGAGGLRGAALRAREPGPRRARPESSCAARPSSPRSRSRTPRTWPGAATSRTRTPKVRTR